MGPIDNVIYSEFKEKFFTFFFEKKKIFFEIFSSKSVMTCPKSENLWGHGVAPLRFSNLQKFQRFLYFFAHPHYTYSKELFTKVSQLCRNVIDKRNYYQGEDK